MDWQTFKQSFKQNDLARLYLFYGEEWYLREHYLAMLKKKIVGDGLEEFNFKTFSENVVFEDLQEAVDSYPVMQERKMVLVRDYDLFKANESVRERFAALIQDIPETCVLVFVFGETWKPDKRVKLFSLFGKVGAVVEFQRAAQTDLITWIKRHFLDLNHDISTELCEHLIFQCGNLMGNLLPEIEKISAYAKKEIIKKEDIDAVVSPCLETIVFDLTKAIVAKDYAQAIQITESLDAMKENAIGVMSLIGKQMRQLYCAGLVLKNGGTVRDFMLLWNMKSDFVAKKMLQSVRGVSVEWLRNALLLCEETDRKLKSGESFPAIRVFIARLAESGETL
ncbi:MAG: DNA polymerase III subunit delta [Ruminococcaceae bacterium]|nr:DNA polymerase III subunit delta [Oscillospiraceae bacterium]